LKLEKQIKNLQGELENQTAKTANWEKDSGVNRTKFLKSTEENKALKATNEELSANLLKAQTAHKKE